MICTDKDANSVSVNHRKISFYLCLFVFLEQESKYFILFVFPQKLEHL